MFKFGKKKKEEDAVDSEEVTIANPCVETPEIPSATVSEESKSKEPPPLTWKEAKALKRSKYEQKIKDNPKFNKMYVLKNKKTDQIVQLRAASSFHACNIIGWKPRKVKILAEQIIPEMPNPHAVTEPVEIKEVKRESLPETTASA